MTRLGWWLVSVLARALEAGERDMVLGDLVESGEGSGAAIRDLLGLIFRRQTGLWMAWRPWVGLFGISGLVGVTLSRIVFRFNADLGLQLAVYSRYGVRYESGLTAQEDIAAALSLAVALLVWSWTCGFVLGSLSGRAAWLTWLVFYFAVLDSAWARIVLSGKTIPSVVPMPQFFISATVPFLILFCLPALYGALLGARRRIMLLRNAYLLASANVILMILVTWIGNWSQRAHEVWSGGMWPGPTVPMHMRLLPFVIVSWPAAYLLATAYRQHTKRPEPV